MSRYGNIKLWWKVPREPDSFNLYHSLAPFGKDELPEPFATDVTVKTYRHLNQAILDDHYYRVASVKDEILYISSLLKVAKKSVIDILSGIVIEALYVESSDIDRLPVTYQNIQAYGGHVCNNAKFGVYANNVFIGDVNLNNNGGGSGHPYNDEYNTPSPLSGGTWSGSSTARYSRIDISEQKAAEIVAGTDSTVIKLKLIAYASSPHNNITWLRVSTKSGNQLHIVQDVSMDLGQEYPVDVLGEE